MGKLREFLYKESPLLLSLGGITGFISGATMAVKATRKANCLMDSYDISSEFDDKTENEKRIERFKLLFPIYAPSVGVFLISSAMILGSHEVMKNRYGIAISLLWTARRRLEQWQQEVLLEVGEKKYSELKAKMTEPEREPSEAEVVFISGDSVVCYDCHSDRYFKMDSVETLRSKMNDMRGQLYSEMFVSVNDWYYEVGLEPLPGGAEIGWSVDSVRDLDISLDTAFIKGTKNPCVTIDFEVEPRYRP